MYVILDKDYWPWLHKREAPAGLKEEYDKVMDAFYDMQNKLEDLVYDD